MGPWEAFVKVAFHVIDRIPAIMLCVMLGIVLTVAVGYLIHRSKKLPYKVIKTGTNGKTMVTADMLEKHCKPIHEGLNKTFTDMVEMQRETKKEVVEIGKQIARLDERTIRRNR